MEDSKQLLREKTSRRNALIDAIEDLNIQMLAIAGEVRWLDQEIEGLLDDVKIDAIRQARERFEDFEEKELARLEKKAEDLEYPLINP